MVKIFRNDDVNPNTHKAALEGIYAVLRDFEPKAEVWSCVTVLGKHAPLGSVYPGLPLKNKPFEYFLDVDKIITLPEATEGSKVVSHGLWHIDHSKVGVELAVASMVSSCRLLCTDTFVPPFNKWTPLLDGVCKENGLRLVKSDEEGWKSFEFNEFDPTHPLWYFHSWKWTPEKLREYLAHGYRKASVTA